MIPYLFMMILFSGIIIRKNIIKFISYTLDKFTQGIDGAIWNISSEFRIYRQHMCWTITISDNIPILKSLIRGY
jgi:hypothetical protein